MKLGPLDITFHRTVRVDKDKTSALPPNLGNLTRYKVSSYRENCPESWEDNAFFIGLCEKEAMWISFTTLIPVAVNIGAGGINALTGEEFKMNLEKDSYLVTPPQPWLDGWKNKDDSVSQFVACCDELSVGKQLGQTKQGIEIGVFGSRGKLKAHKTPEENVFPPFGSCCTKGFRSETCHELSLGKGGKIEQKIYPDPYGLDAWLDYPLRAITVYLINGPQFAEITGKELPPIPVTSEEYGGLWYGVKDETLDDIAGSDTFDNLDSAF